MHFKSRVETPLQLTQYMVLFPFQNRKEPKFLALNTTAGGGGHISRPFHSNAYLDLDRDGNSDIFLTAEDRFEIWINNPSTSASSEGAEDTLKYRLEKTIGLEDCHGKADCIIGQVSYIITTWQLDVMY